MSEAPTADDIAAAAVRIAPYVHRTPVLRSRSIDERAGTRVHLKAEHLQRAGSFKARGAHNTLLQLDPDEQARGVVAVSSGNHAAAVACAGRALGIEVDVLMPTDAPTLKLRAARSYGATVHPFDRHADDRMAMLAEFAERHGKVPVVPFDDPRIIAGQGTAGAEFVEQVDLDTLVVPTSGGGLMAGCAIAARAARPDLRVIGVEPAAGDDWARSFAAGERVTIDQPVTIADGLAVRSPGRLTFPIARALVDEIVTVTEDEIAATCLLLFERAKQVVEPSGAAALAAVVNGSVTGSDVGVILSGGNIGLDELARIAARPPAER